MLVQNRDARLMHWSDIHGQAGDKTLRLIGPPGTERASQRCLRWTFMPE
jgi:hypothetical protein